MVRGPGSRNPDRRCVADVSFCFSGSALCLEKNLEGATQTVEQRGGGGGQAEGDVQGGGGPLLRPRSGPMQPCVQALGDFVRGELRGAV
jgi:hypothetical protein